MVFLSIDADAFPFTSVSGVGPRLWGFFFLVDREEPTPALFLVILV